MSRQPSLDIIVVNWNTGALLRECLESISQARTGAFRLERVVVVDNNSADGSDVGLEGLFEQPISVFHNDLNRGFGAACNQGAAGTKADYLLFLNPDTRVFPDSLWRPLEFLEQEENAKVGICGVRHVDDSGAFSTSCARFPTLKIFFGQMTGLSRLFPRCFPPHLMAEAECLESREVDQVIGAFFLVRRSLFEALGGFDPRFFVYFEEVDFSLRARQAGFRSYYLATATAYHKGGGSSQQAKAARLFYSLRSRLLYGFKHHSFLDAFALALLTLTIEMAARLLAALGSLSLSKLVETVQGYSALFVCLCTKKAAMAIIDKRACIPQLDGATLELGCGGRKRHPEAIGIDALDHECVDIVGDVYEVLEQVPTASVKAVYAYHFFEHVSNLPKLMDLLARVIQPGGLLRVVVPHFSNPYFYSDHTHRGFFGLYSFSYLVSDTIHRRKVPTYGREVCFQLSHVDLIFKSSPPFYVRYACKQLLQAVFNLNRYTRELYEENFCYLFPCYEIRFEMRRTSS